MKKDIAGREDVSLLVHTFYKKVKANKDIGFFFNETINDWDEHLAKLTDFWESNLFLVQKFKGRPGRAHIEVDYKYEHKIEAYHFGVWLNLWFETLDELFEGPLAERAKNHARNLGHNFFMKIFSARPKQA
ncbi:MAG: group III truncated hemoglobin [Mesonia hippocampi]|uniref:group III truncated hemoglobin n=1 Tax=Mesonia hippocampi TaxID=1628250 RepID=UPI003F996B07